MWCCAAPSTAPEVIVPQNDGRTVDVDHLQGSRVAKDCLGLKEQPESPTYFLALVQIFVRPQKFGGSDKSSNGHRYDSIPFANGMIGAGMSCQLLHYVHDEHDEFFETLKKFDGIIVRCNPGQINADGGSQNKFDDAMRALRKQNATQIWSTPDVMEFMGAKDALIKVKDTSIGLPDTSAYYTVEDFTAGFKKTMAFQPRVVKQNRGSSGEGIWIIKLKSEAYCAEFGEKSCEGSDLLLLTEANDNHEEEHTVAEFIEFCCNGRTDSSGKWDSKGEGKYLAGGKAAGGQIVDQRFCPRIIEGVLRYNMICDACVGIIHKKPKEGGISAVGGTGSVYTYYGPTEEQYKHVSDKFQAELPKLMAALDLAMEPLPLWWTSDFINSSPAGAAGGDEKWIVGEFNCSCVGISACLEAFCNDENPEAKFTDISEEKLAEATKYGDLIGKKAHELLSKNHPSSVPVDVSSITRVAKNYQGQMLQPANPKYKIALVQIYVRPAKFGGTDKSYNHHRYDSIPFANGCIEANMSCQLIHYIHQEYDKFFELMLQFDALIVRCNPGQIAADGGDQAKFDLALRGLRKKDIGVWPSPDVMEFMGAKDALVKVRHLGIGLEDTLAYYDKQTFEDGFKKTMAFQPRVIKQNRGSAGEGIWIIKLKTEKYCKSFGERSCEDTEVLKLMEANDNHEEEHTVAEFIEFCTKGKTPEAGEWTSKGEGKYLEGGKEKGGQLVDQRFCPRIVEGERRYNMVGDSLLGIIHKKPKEGGISAVSGTGSIYTYFKPQEKTCEALTKRFLEEDLPKVMHALDLGTEPLPLWWTSDFILASPVGTAPKAEKWIVGEFNCSCVGISKCLAAYCKPDTPKAGYNDIEPTDLEEAKAMGALIGLKALRILDINAVNRPVDMSGVTRMATDFYGVLPPPAKPVKKAAIVQIHSQRLGYGYPSGADKSANGHRYDSVPIANGVINAGMSCQLIHYVPEEHDKFFEVCKGFDVLIIRCAPGHIRRAGGDQKKFDDAISKLKKEKKTIFSSSDVVEKLGGKDALTKLSKLSFGTKDAFVHYDAKSLEEGLRKTLAAEPRVLKQNRGLAGEGVWVCKLKDADYGVKDRRLRDDEIIVMTEACDNHSEEHKLSEIVEFFTMGRTPKSGMWTTCGLGKYLTGGKEAGGMVLDQRFFPRATEAELRFTLVGDSLWSADVKTFEDANNLGQWTWATVDMADSKYKAVIDKFSKDIQKITPAVGLKETDAPLLWNLELVNSSDHGVSDEAWVAIDINCYCVGNPACNNAIAKESSPDCSYVTLSDDEKAAAKVIGDEIGKKVHAIATKGKFRASR